MRAWEQQDAAAERREWLQARRARLQQLLEDERDSWLLELRAQRNVAPQVYQLNKNEEGDLGGQRSSSVSACFISFFDSLLLVIKCCSSSPVTFFSFFFLFFFFFFLLPISFLLVADAPRDGQGAGCGH